jgi:hypothetical protein
MRTIGILLLAAALFGLWASTQAFGDIGLAFLYGAAISGMAGIGFLTAAKPVNAWKDSDRVARNEAIARDKERSKALKQQKQAETPEAGGD